MRSAGERCAPRTMDALRRVALPPSPSFERDRMVALTFTVCKQQLRAKLTAGNGGFRANVAAALRFLGGLGYACGCCGYDTGIN